MSQNQERGWLLDESAHAGEEHLDPEYVLGYDRKAGTDPEDDIALLRESGLDRSQTVVDLGAGTGTFALAVAPYCRRVVAVDVSLPMLESLQRNAGERGVGNVECVNAGFLSYVHAGEPPAFVYSRNALHHLPDFWKAVALDRIARMMRTGGVFRLRDLVYSFDPPDVEPVFEAWLAGAAATPELGWTHAELELHVRSEYSTFSWLLEPMLERAGFAVQDVSHEKRVYSAYTCVKR